MKKLFTLILICTSLTAVSQKKKPAANPNKTAVIQSVDKHQQDLIGISDKVWAYAET
ncbi:MAG: amidohydrolase, partial [Cyclobacteriaceae bacterium]|nr:amidohydrolase [Cyclobacteriaceae bacterium]